jgi:hypothetical protein
MNQRLGHQRFACAGRACKEISMSWAPLNFGKQLLIKAGMTEVTVQSHQRRRYSRTI